MDSNKVYYTFEPDMEIVAAYQLERPDSSNDSMAKQDGLVVSGMGLCALRRIPQHHLAPSESHLSTVLKNTIIQFPNIKRQKQLDFLMNQHPAVRRCLTPEIKNYVYRLLAWRLKKGLLDEKVKPDGMTTDQCSKNYFLLGTPTRCDSLFEAFSYHDAGHGEWYGQYRTDCQAYMLGMRKSHVEYLQTEGLSDKDVYIDWDTHCEQMLEIDWLFDKSYIEISVMAVMLQTRILVYHYDRLVRDFGQQFAHKNGIMRLMTTDQLEYFLLVEPGKQLTDGSAHTFTYPYVTEQHL